MTGNERKQVPEVDTSVDFEITIPAPAVSSSLSAGTSGLAMSLSLRTSLIAQPEASLTFEARAVEIIDILGSAVAESTGWRPPEYGGVEP